MFSVLKTLLNKDSIQEGKNIPYYRDKALSMMNIHNVENEEYFYMWLNEFEYVTNMIGVPDKNMAELFVSMVHDDVRKRILEAYPHVDISELSYDEILTKYLDLYSVHQEFYFFRGCFVRRNQYVKETIQKYAYNLRKIFDKCRYTTNQERKLCERFIKGIRDDDIRTYLSNKSSYLSFDQIVIEATKFAKENLISYYLDEAYLKIQTYNPKKKGEFYVWLNKFEYVADLIEVPDNKMIEFFNNMVDNDVHTSIKQTLPTVNFSGLSYEEIINYYLRYFDPFNESDLHRKRFECRNQYEKETIKKYADSLRKIYNKVNYTNNREAELCKQFFNGIRDDEIRADLKHFTGITFNYMVELAIGFANVNEITLYLNPARSMIQTYSPQTEGMFCTWLNKFEYVADCVGVPDFKMIEFFNNMMNSDVHMSVRKTFYCVNFSKLSYEEILNYYLRYFSVSNVTNFYRSRFMSRNQYEEETIENYAYDLQKIYDKCNYTNHRNERLCEQFRSGIRDDKIRIQLKNYVTNTIKISDDRILEYFNNMVDNDVHSAVKMTYPAINLSELSYEKKINVYLHYLAPSCDLYKTRFLSRIQFKHETIENYANSLRKLSDWCSITNRLDKVLCEQFLNGIYDNEIKTILKKLHGFSFDEMVEFASELIKFKKITTYLQPAYSRLKTFHSVNEEEFYVWLNKFEYVASIFEVSDDEIIELFNTMVHNDIHTRVQERYTCVKFSELSYEEIVNRYLRCLCLSTESYLHRKRFHCRKQYEHETIENYARVLRKIYDKCNYSDISDKILCEHFLNGINDYKIKTFIRKYPDLSFNVVVAIAIAYSNELAFMEN
ncbi:hypothetical protein M0804_013381 [Polistes exclamans]|nr:hypothetical protein M0804_013381 [Polistes exclamans]